MQGVRQGGGSGLAARARAEAPLPLSSVCKECGGSKEYCGLCQMYQPHFFEKCRSGVRSRGSMSMELGGACCVLAKVLLCCDPGAVSSGGRRTTLQGQDSYGRRPARVRPRVGPHYGTAAVQLSHLILLLWLEAALASPGTRSSSILKRKNTHPPRREQHSWARARGW